MSYEYMSGMGQQPSAQTGAAVSAAVAHALAKNLSVYKNQRQIRQNMLTKFGRSTASQGDTCSPPTGGVVRKLHARIPLSKAELLKQQAAMTPILKSGCLTKGRMFDLQNMELCCPPDAQLGPPVVPWTAPEIAPDELEVPEAEPETVEDDVSIHIPVPSVSPLPSVFPPPSVSPITNGYSTVNGNGFPPVEYPLPMGPAEFEPQITNGAVMTNGASVTNGNGNGVVDEEKKYLGFTAIQLAIGVVGAGALYMLFIRK